MKKLVLLLCPLFGISVLANCGGPKEGDIFNVSWRNYDGSTLKTEQYYYGEMPSYKGTPYRPEDEEYTYTFSGWDPEVVKVTKNAIYTAKFEAVKIENTTISFSFAPGDTNRTIKFGIQGELTKVDWGDTTVNTEMSHTYSSSFSSGQIQIYGNSLSEVRLNYEGSSNNSITSVSLGNKLSIINPYCFNNLNKLVSVKIPESIEWISNNAFNNCPLLTSVYVPSKAKIGGRICEGCSSLNSITVSPDNPRYDSRNNCNAIISKVDEDYTKKDTLILGCKTTSIPNNVQIIGYGAFSSINSFTSINIPDSVTSIQGSAFNKCSNLKSINFGKNLKAIGGDAFSDCVNLESISIPDTVEEIGDFAFARCSKLKSIYIGSSVTKLGLYVQDVFMYCPLIESIVISNKNTSFYAPNNCNAIVTKKEYQRYDEVIPQDTLLFACNKTTIPEGIKNIYQGAFSDLENIKNITIPSTVAIIDYAAFRNCSNIESISVSSSNANYDSRNSCNMIVSKKEVTTFHGTIPANTTILGCKNSTIPEGVEIIIGGFENCNGLTSINIPSTVKSISSSCFAGCKDLTTITVDSGNEYYDSRNSCNAIITKKDISQYQKKDCLIQGCKNSTIPSSVISIGGGAFYGMPITSISIPNNITSLATEAFGNCKSLKTVSIGSGVTQLNTYAFDGCTSLESISIDSNNTKYDSRNNCNAIIYKQTDALLLGSNKTVIPNTVKFISSEAFESCAGLTTINIPSSVTSIGMWAFNNCSSLKTVTIENGVTSIDDQAFENCTAVSSITIPSSVTEMGGWVFNHWTDKQTIYVPFKEGQQPSGWDYNWASNCCATIIYKA